MASAIPATELSPKAQRLWGRLQAVAEAVPAAIDGQLRRDAGLTRYEYYVLRMLSKAPERSMLMSELAAATNGSVSRLSHAADRLERNGWIERDRLPSDRRATTATLTDGGIEKLRASTPGHLEAMQELIFDHLTDQQVEALDRALEPLAAALHLSC